MMGVITRLRRENYLALLNGKKCRSSLLTVFTETRKSSSRAKPASKGAGSRFGSPPSLAPHVTALANFTGLLILVQTSARTNHYPGGSSAALPWRKQIQAYQGTQKVITAPAKRNSINFITLNLYGKRKRSAARHLPVL